MYSIRIEIGRNPAQNSFMQGFDSFLSGIYDVPGSRDIFLLFDVFRHFQLPLFQRDPEHVPLGRNEGGVQRISGDCVSGTGDRGRFDLFVLFGVDCIKGIIVDFDGFHHVFCLESAYFEIQVDAVVYRTVHCKKTNFSGFPVINHAGFQIFDRKRIRFARVFRRFTVLFQHHIARYRRKGTRWFAASIRRTELAISMKNLAKTIVIPHGCVENFVDFSDLPDGGSWFGEGVLMSAVTHHVVGYSVNYPHPRKHDILYCGGGSYAFEYGPEKGILAPGEILVMSNGPRQNFRALDSADGLFFLTDPDIWTEVPFVHKRTPNAEIVILLMKTLLRAVFSGQWRRGAAEPCEFDSCADPAGYLHAVGFGVSDGTADGKAPSASRTAVDGRGDGENLRILCLASVCGLPGTSRLLPLWTPHANPDGICGNASDENGLSGQDHRFAVWLHSAVFVYKNLCETCRNLSG